VVVAVEAAPMVARVTAAAAKVFFENRVVTACSSGVDCLEGDHRLHTH